MRYGVRRDGGGGGGGGWGMWSNGGGQLEAPSVDIKTFFIDITHSPYYKYR